MTAYLLLDHILNFIAPAAVVALVLVLAARLFNRFLVSNRLFVQSIWAQLATIFIVNIFVLVAGLVFFSNDGKMATYAAMVVAAALSQWVVCRGWKA